MAFHYSKNTPAIYGGDIVKIPDEVIADLKAWECTAFPCILPNGVRRRVMLDIANSTFDTICLRAENRHPQYRDAERCHCCGAIKKTIAPIVA